MLRGELSAAEAGRKAGVSEQSVRYQAERRQLATARRAVFAEVPSRLDRVWQAGFSEFQTGTDRTWQLVEDCTDGDTDALRARWRFSSADFYVSSTCVSWLG